MHEYNVINLKHSTHVTNDALPSRISVIIELMLNTVLVNGAANEASSVDNANPTSAYLNAHVSFVPSPQNARKFYLFYFSNIIKSPLLLGFIRAYTYMFTNNLEIITESPW